MMVGFTFMMCGFTSTEDCAALAGTCAVVSTCQAEANDESWIYPEPAECEAVGDPDSGIAMSQVIPFAASLCSRGRTLSLPVCVPVCLPPCVHVRLWVSLSFFLSLCCVRACVCAVCHIYPRDQLRFSPAAVQENCEAATPTCDTDCTCVFAPDSACDADLSAVSATLDDRAFCPYLALYFCMRVRLLVSVRRLPHLLSRAVLPEAALVQAPVP